MRDGLNPPGEIRHRVARVNAHTHADAGVGPIETLGDRRAAVVHFGMTHGGRHRQRHVATAAAGLGRRAAVLSGHRRRHGHRLDAGRSGRHAVFARVGVVEILAVDFGWALLGTAAAGGAEVLAGNTM